LILGNGNVEADGLHIGVAGRDLIVVARQLKTVRIHGILECCQFSWSMTPFFYFVRYNTKRS
jgi:hypothetical protein